MLNLFSSSSSLSVLFFLFNLTIYSITIANCSTEKKVDVNSLLSENKALLLYFYVPNCLSCDAIRPHFDRASEYLTNNPKEIGLSLNIVRIDATQDNLLAEQLKVQEYPALKLLQQTNNRSHSGKYFNYNFQNNNNKEISSDDIISWTLHCLRHSIQNIHSIQDAMHFKQQSDVAVLGLFKDLNSTESLLFQLISSAFPADMLFGISDNPLVCQHFQLSHNKDNKQTVAQIIIFKRLENVEIPFDGEFQRDLLLKFLQIHGRPLLREQSLANGILELETDYKIIFFLSKTQYSSLQSTLLSVAKSNQWKKNNEELLSVSLVNVNDLDNQQWMTNTFGIDVNHLTIGTYRMIKYQSKTGELIKFRPINEPVDENRDFSFNNLHEFVEQVVNGSIKEYYRSEALPSNWNDSIVKILVESNFYSFLTSNERNKPVLVLFYSSSSIPSTHILVVWEKLGEYLDKQEDQSVIIAKVDVSRNELPAIAATSANLPLIQLFPLNSIEGIEYNGERTLNGLTDFIDSGGKDGALARSDEDEKDYEDYEDEENSGRDEL